MSDVLLIDDDEKLAGPLAEYFARYGLTLHAATHPRAGLERLAAGGIDLVILDVMLPDVDGFDVCRTIRQRSRVPVIMLTARGEVTDRIVGLELGADDYLGKPFEPRELVARVHNVLRRSGAEGGEAPADAPLRFAGLDIDRRLREVRVRGKNARLTTNEYRLLLLLVSDPGRSFSRDEILNHLRGIDADIYSRAVDILVSRLRQKLKPLDYIKTVWGAGYSFVAPPP